MTTSLSQLHPQKDFSAKKSGYSTVYWVAAGVGTLVATGLAAFTSFKDAPDTPTASTPAALALHVSAASPADSESEAAANAAFGEDAAEREVAEPEQTPPSDAPGPGAAHANPEAAAMPLPAALDDDPDADAAADAHPTANTLEQATLGAYYVQLASYRTKETADAHAKALVSRGFPAQSFAYGGPSAGWWHAVRLGPFEDRVSAEKRRFDLETVDRRAAYVLPRSNGKFHVQVASFAEREEAEQIAKSFNAEGHPTKVTRVKMSGSHWYCVRIGPFDTREEAVAYKALVPNIPGSQSTVIPFPPPPAR